MASSAVTIVGACLMLVSGLFEGCNVLQALGPQGRGLIESRRPRLRRGWTNT